MSARFRYSSDMTQPFTMSYRHQRMFLEGLDMIGASLKFEDEIAAFAQRHWDRQPWVKDVAVRTPDSLTCQQATDSLSFKRVALVTEPIQFQWNLYPSAAFSEEQQQVL